MRISLVIPTLNAGPLFDEVLESILALRGTRFDELVAVDSGSSDGTVEKLLRAGFAVHEIPKARFDHGGTRDLGIGKTTGDIVVLLVQDATLQGADWLQKMVEPFADPEVAGVWCRQVPRPVCQPVLKRRILGWPGWGEGVTKKRLPEGKQLDELAAFVPARSWRRLYQALQRFNEEHGEYNGQDAAHRS